jgi:hypothetical protein
MRTGMVMNGTESIKRSDENEQFSIMSRGIDHFLPLLTLTPGKNHQVKL